VNQLPHPTDSSTAESAARSGQTLPIAIVGVSALFPGALDVAAFWRDILEGRDRLSDVPRTHWLSADYYDPRPVTPDKVCTTRGGFIPEVEFSPLEFGFPPNIAQATDTAQLLGLVVAKRALADAAGGRFEKMDRSRISVVLGVASATELVAHMSGRLQLPVVERALRASGLDEAATGRALSVLRSCYVPWQESTFPGLLGNVVAGRIANRLDLGGTNAVVDAACASSLAAVDIAINELSLGRSDLVLTGGVDTLNDILMYMCFAQTGALSPTGDCRPFSEDADGTMLGEGIGIVALKRLADAERDGDAVYAVIRGVGTSSDGRAKSIYAPAPEGQALALTRAYERAGYGPETVELLEAHGTATKAGDAAEVQALRTVFARAGARAASCALGSVKSQIGHTKAAAGSAGLIKAALALHHKVLPGTYKVKAPSATLELEGSPFYLNTKTRPWLRPGTEPRRASVSALGFGGTNFHVALEEYRGTAPRPKRQRTCPSELVLVSGADANAVASRCRAIANGPLEPGALVHQARQTQLVFDSRAPARLGIVSHSEAELREKLLAAAEAIEKGKGAPFSTPRGIHFGVGASLGPVAFLFPGQGSQYVGMGQDLAVHFDCVRAEWDQHACLGEDGDATLSEVVFPPPVWGAEAEARLEQRLTRTEWAQPAIAATSLALLRLLEAIQLEPSFAGGHSLGEVTALGACGAFERGATVRLARRRGELVAQAASEPGAMTAIAVGLEEAKRLVADENGRVVIANHNAPKQVVLSGAEAAILAVERRAQAQGLEARRLPVSTAFHSPLVSAACAPLREHLDGMPVAPLRVPVFSSQSGAVAPSEADQLREAVARAVADPVLFVDQIEALYAAGARVFVEVGPGSVLTRLVGRCLGDRSHLAVDVDARGKHGVTSLWDALARLSAAGVALQFDALWADQVLPAEPSTAEKPKLSLRLSGANYGKPVPPDAAAGRTHSGSDSGAKAVKAVNEAARGDTGDDVAKGRQSGLESRTEPASAAPRVPAPAAPVAAPPVAAPPAPLQSGSSGGAPRVLHPSVIAAQMEYERLMAESHMEFLRAVAASYGAAGVSPAAHAFAPPIEAPRAGGTDAPLRPPPPAAEPVRATPPLPLEPAAALESAPVIGPAPTPEPGAVAAPPREEGPDLVGLMLAVVSEKTGYPAEMLELTMDMESDLGIDSIKRVEILAAVRKRAPGLPEVDTGRMSRMRTLQEIVEYLGGGATPVAAHASEAQKSASTASVSGNESTAAQVDLVGLMLAVVSEKTGYPAEMLELTMDMESDLGIDSIKRVEILAAVRKRAPGLPEVDTGRMSRMRTLQEIVEFLGGGAPAATQATSNGGAAAPLPSAVPAGEGAEPVARFVTRVRRAPPVGFALRGLFGATRVAITSDGATLATRLAERLGSYGVSAHAVESVPADADAVIFLGGLRAADTLDAALAVNREAFAVARGVAGRFRESGGVFVTVQDTGGDFGLGGADGVRAYLAGVGALVKTAAQEWPKASLRAIDLERGGRDEVILAEVLAQELLFGGTELEVGLSAQNERLVPTNVPAPTPSAGRAVSSGAVFVVTGGARGVTAASVLALARAASPRLLMLGRTPLEDEPEDYRGIAGDAELKRAALAEAKRLGVPATPKDIARRVSSIVANREVRETRSLLEAEGAEVRYAAVDVRDRAALGAVLAETRAAWGPIQGLVHGAGVLSDALIENKSDAQFDQVFGTKVLGLRALLELTASDPLEWIGLFSSVAARTGNAGQADYAMANEVLNKVASAEQRRRGDACRVVSIGWGPWDGGMVTPILREHFAARGVALLPVDAGAAAFVRELGSAGDVEVGIGGAGELTLGTRSSTSEVDVLVSAARWPELDSHRIQGRVVVPMVMALEWFARFSEGYRRDAGSLVFRDLRVVRGITLAEPTKASPFESFRLSAAPAADASRVTLELRDTRGGLRYAATLELGSNPDEPALPEPSGLGASPWEPAAYYGPNTLFHGPHFQVLRQIEGISRSHARATIAGTREAGWSGEWHAEPAGLDGALQLALLFGLHSGIGPALPMRAERVVVRSGQGDGLLRCDLSQRSLSRDSLACDLALTDARGVRILDLAGVEMFVVPSGTTAN
jgi:acyl transferase domain-containing protein